MTWEQGMVICLSTSRLAVLSVYTCFEVHVHILSSMPSSLANKSGICVSQKYCSSFPDTGLVPRAAHITSNTESDLHWVWDSLVLELDSL